MATFKITPDSSIYKNTDFANAFDSDSPAADTLIVDVGAFLIATGEEGIGAALGFFGNTGAWTVTVNGSIISVQDTGISLAGSTGTSRITVGLEGSVSGIYGIAAGSAVTIQNAGVITGTSFSAIQVTTAGVNITNTGLIQALVSGSGHGISILSGADGNFSIVNKGTISASVYGINLDNTSGIHLISNSGTIRGDWAISANDPFGVEKVTNSGVFAGSVRLGGGDDSLINSGEIFGSVNMEAGADTVTNSGLIDIDIMLGDGSNKLTNSGYISRALSALGGNDVVINTKVIGLGSDLGSGNNSFTNSGTAGALTVGDGNDIIKNSGELGAIATGKGDDVVVNSGTITGTIVLGDGHDTFTNFIGTKSGLGIFGLDLGAGDDKFFGSNLDESINDSAGSDTIKLGGGDDRFITASPVLDAYDYLDGGAGVDTFDVSGSGQAWIIDLATEAFNTVTLGVDDLTGFENVFGGSNGDKISGTAAANFIVGNGGVDHLKGLDGNDVVQGGAGSDVLTGGKGKDELHGGGDGDTFVYEKATDSGAIRATRDVIQDFSGLDTIDLQLIDANTKNGLVTNEGFAFIGTNNSFSGNAGELRVVWTAEGQTIEADLNGDKRADFSIAILDPTHAITLSAGDFIL